MTRARWNPPRTAVLALSAAAIMALGGCEKPSPGVTTWSGTNSTFQRAVCWQPDAASGLTPGQCAQSLLQEAAAGQGVPGIAVAPGDVVGISVDPVVADHGWGIRVGGQDFVTGLTGTYFRFTFPEQGASPQGYVLQVTANNTQGAPRGHWFFRLQPR